MSSSVKLLVMFISGLVVSATKSDSECRYFEYFFNFFMNWLSEKFSTTSKIFVTKLSFGSDRARRAESKTYINLPSRVPLEFSRNSQSPKIGCFCLKLLSNWGFTQTMHRAVE